MRLIPVFLLFLVAVPALAQIQTGPPRVMSPELFAPAPAAPAWEFSGGLAVSARYEPAYRIGGAWSPGKLGWAGELSLWRTESHETAMETRLAVTSSGKHGKRGVEISRTRTERDWIGAGYEIMTGPTYRLFTRGDVFADCRGLAGAVLEAAWRLAIRGGCGLGYHFDTAVGVRVTGAYFRQADDDGPEVGVEWFVRF